MGAHNIYAKLQQGSAGVTGDMITIPGVGSLIGWGKYPAVNGPPATANTWAPGATYYYTGEEGDLEVFKNVGTYASPNWEEDSGVFVSDGDVAGLMFNYGTALPSEEESAAVYEDDAIFALISTDGLTLYKNTGTEGEGRWQVIYSTGSNTPNVWAGMRIRNDDGLIVFAAGDELLENAEMAQGGLFLLANGDGVVLKSNAMGSWIDRVTFNTGMPILTGGPTIENAAGLFVYSTKENAGGEVMGFGASDDLVDWGGESSKPAVGLWGVWSRNDSTGRQIYNRLKITGAGGGEAIRNYTVNYSVAPVDTVNGAHTSLGFGFNDTFYGNVTGLATAERHTLHIPAWAIGGTITSVQAEIYADDAASDVSGTASLIRAIIDGNGTGKATLGTKVALLEVVAASGAYNSGCLVSATSDATMTAALKVKINGVVKWLPLIDAPTNT